MIVDWKYKIVATNPCSKSAHTEVDSMLFLATDRAVPAMLKTYRTECERIGAEQSHLESIDLLYNRVVEFQKIVSKIPDTNTPCEIDRCIGGNVY